MHAAKQGLEAGGARRLRNESFFSAPQLKRDSLRGKRVALSWCDEATMTKTTGLSILLLLAAAQLPAQSLPADSLFDRLIGHWVLRGTMARQSTTHDVDFEWMLGREYVKMHEVSREPGPNGAPPYEAVVLFGRDPRSGEYAVLWLDNTGASAFDPQGIGRGTVTGDSVPFVFHYTQTNGFHTTFVYSRATDSWQWHMDND